MNKVYKNLKDVKVNDWILIGIEGQREKLRATVVKITDSDRIKTNFGDIFNRDGFIWKRKSHFTKGKKRIFATPITERDFNRIHHNININFLKKFDWERCTNEQLEAVLGILPLKFQNKVQRSNFK